MSNLTGSRKDTDKVVVMPAVAAGVSRDFRVQFSNIGRPDEPIHVTDDQSQMALVSFITRSNAWHFTSPTYGLLWWSDK
jgi:hypothetical protein